MTAAQVVVVGSSNLDLIVEVPALAVPGQTVLGGDVVIRPGGKGANQAVAAHRLGARTFFVSAVGTDGFGDTLRSKLASEGLDLAGVTRVDHPSGVALIVVDPAGENVITVSPGANHRLAAEHLDGLEEHLGAGCVLLMQLETPVATMLAAAELAHAAGAQVVLNAAPIPALPDDELTQLLAAVDVLIVNQGEALALAPQPRPQTPDDWCDVATDLRRLGPRITVITLGAAGAVWSDGTESATVPSRSVAVVDTTGAGDAFCGAFAAALADGRSVDDAVRQGCLAGSLATTAIGAQTALPTADDLAAHAAAEVRT